MVRRGKPIPLKVARLLCNNGRGMKQLELFYRTGIAQSKLSRIENGWLEPSPEEKRRIAAELRVKVEDILWTARPDNDGRR